MSIRAAVIAEIQSWDEVTYREVVGGGKLTRASVRQTFTGGLEGDGTMEFLMCYRPDGTASFVGQQHVVGTVGGRSGSFALHASGLYDGTGARWSCSVVPGSGTEGLRGLRGDATSVAEHVEGACSMMVSQTFDFDFD